MDPCVLELQLLNNRLHSTLTAGKLKCRLKTGLEPAKLDISKACCCVCSTLKVLLLMAWPKSMHLHSFAHVNDSSAVIGSIVRLAMSNSASGDAGRVQ